MAVQYKIPDYVHISQDCKQLLSRLFVATPSRVCIMLLLLNLVLITEIWVSYNVLQLSCLISLSISYKNSRRHLLKPFVLIGNYFFNKPYKFYLSLFLGNFLGALTLCRVIMCLLTIYFVIEKPFSIDGKIDWYGCSMGPV